MDRMQSVTRPVTLIFLPFMVVGLELVENETTPFTRFTDQHLNVVYLGKCETTSNVWYRNTINTRGDVGYTFQGPTRIDPDPTPSHNVTFIFLNFSRLFITLYSICVHGIDLILS